MSKKIGIINCSNFVNDLNCCASCCLDAARNCTGFFEKYKQYGGVEIVGLLSCSGCATLMAHEKILRRVRSLIRAGAEIIHFSSCINNICPFKNKYQSIIEKYYPDIKIEIGTHPELINDENQLPMFGGMIIEYITAQNKDIVDILDTADAINECKLNLNIK
ncbi:MAG: CGGC domain-containing protein [Candidatus Odinarchaeota archaeon]